MALTKVEAAKLTDDMLLRGVIETIVMESPVLQRLPFMEVVGTGLTYNREATLPAATFYEVGDTWTESTPTFTQVTTGLKILGGDADIDHFLLQTYRDPNELEAIVIQSKAKAVAHAFLATFYTGDASADPKQFDGLRRLVPASQTFQPGPNGGSLTLELLDQLVDLVKPGKPDALLMSKRTRRKLSQLRRQSGTVLESDVDQFGQRVLFYDGIPVLVDDFVPDNETLGTGTGLSSIYAVKWGPSGLMGLENGGIVVEEVGALETKNARRWRVRWYCGLALFSTVAVARLQGIAAN
ncbi:major capsid protein [Thermomicrobium roseum]|uniref:Putative phage structural protein n=1 Tax=Thermomicrobium roseum (strain ATCC 27502 / DSM 5159 / P-2) TaxID=309801 RepID=B9L0F1_THERP|nr:phage major capsid protein [Thermomicrobium roseum]ACM06326.1 putative phage structural protein [Thermomicrobium roseum DSM 5159]